MNTLKFGNGEWYGKKDTILAYNDENSNFKPLPFSFDRASSATRVNKDGLIETVGSGEPRIDFKDNTKGALKLEPQRSNLISYSNDYSQSYWRKGLNTTVTNNYAISPEGKQNATRIQMPDTTYTFLDAYFLNLQGSNLTISFYAKNNGGAASMVTFNPIDALETINLTDEWVRYVVTGVGNSNVRVGIDNISGGGDVDFLLYGFQLEVGSYATSYIPTSGQANGVTRVADVCNNGANEQVINSTEGVLYFEGKIDDNSVSKMISISDGTLANRLTIEYSQYINNAIAVQLFSNSVSQLLFNNIISDYKINNKIAVSFKSGSIKFYANGIKINEVFDTFSFSSNLSKLNFNYGTQTGLPFYGNVKDVRIYNTALTDQELIALTTI